MKFLRRLRKKHNTEFQAGNGMSIWAGALAHEIKNPLNTMRINLQLLEEEWNQSDESSITKTRKRFGTLNSEIDRLEEILNDFLRFARLPQPTFEKNNIAILVNELLDFTEPEAQQLNINIKRDINPDLPEIYLDSGQIKQALLNLILNAYQSMSSGGELAVKVYKIDSHVSIDVTDTGDGIPTDRIGKLFNLFYSTKENGTGLGLSITKRIMDMHNGEIQIKSEEGKGSTFSMILPIHQLISK
jgi:signal transduction histidine kinase